VEAKEAVLQGTMCGRWMGSLGACTRWGQGRGGQRNGCIGTKQQMTTGPDISPLLNKVATTQIQEIVSILLCHGQATGNTMLVPCGFIATNQPKGGNACIQLLNCAALHPDAILCFAASGTILHTHCDASNLSETEAHSCAGRSLSLEQKQ
jgi:hypothetical protein